MAEEQRSFEELEALFAAAKPEHVLLNNRTRKVFRVIDERRDCVIKYGTGPSLREAEALRYIFENQNKLRLPAPKLYHAYKCQPGEQSVIEMEFLPGETLRKFWEDEKTDAGMKTDMARQIAELVGRMRSMERQSIGDCGTGPAADFGRFAVETGGPFESEEDFNDFRRSNIIEGAPQIYRQMLRQAMPSDHKIVFTHSDIRPDNILVQNGRLTGLIDWEFSGFYPEYWEYVQFFRAREGRLEDWYNYTDLIFPMLYAQEYFTDNFLSRISRH